MGLRRQDLNGYGRDWRAPIAERERLLRLSDAWEIPWREPGGEVVEHGEKPFERFAHGVGRSLLVYWDHIQSNAAQLVDVGYRVWRGFRLERGDSESQPLDRSSAPGLVKKRGGDRREALVHSLLRVRHGAQVVIVHFSLPGEVVANATGAGVAGAVDDGPGDSPAGTP